MRKIALYVFILTGAVVLSQVGQRHVQAAYADKFALPQKIPVKVERLDSSVDRIVPQSPVLEKLATGFTWVEGPVWEKNGDLLFAEITSNSIRELTPYGNVRIFLQPSGYQGAVPYGGPEPGSNGMTLDARGRLTVAGHARRMVYRLESMDPHARLTVLADQYRGEPLNSPNDLVYRSDGSLYFTDPPYGLRTQKESDPDKKLRINGVYRIPAALQQAAGAPPSRSSLQLIIGGLTRPNGIAFSPDEKFLYVSNSEPKKLWMKYPVKDDGTVGPGTVLYDATSDTREGLPDGMKVDAQGDIISAGPGGLWILSSAGKHIGTILLPERAANVAWGGQDNRMLYIMATSSIYRIHLNVPGAPTPYRPR